MSNITTANINLPDKIEDLAKFVLVGREKLTVVRANIRAIDKLQLAQDVREQKKEEAQMLAEALLDAEVKIGDLLKKIPKNNNFKGNQYTEVNSHQCENTKKQETKQEVITRLGFNKDQANRFETLSSNKEIVEQVKAEARENEDIPTRSRVLQLVKEKTKDEQFIESEFKKIEEETAVQINLNTAIYKILCTDITEEYLEIWYNGLNKTEREMLEDDLDRAIEEYQKIKEFIKEKTKIRRIK